MAAPKRTPTQREKDLLEISRLYLAGKIQVEIAEILNVSQPQISYDLAILRGRWLKASIANIDELKAKELAKVDRLELEYWDAWQRSLEEFRSKTVKAKGANTEEAKKTAEQTLKTEDRNGDPRYLQGVQWCIERRCKILGIDAPAKLEHSGELKLEDTNGLTQEQKLRAVASLINALSSRDGVGSADEPDMAATEHPAMAGAAE